MTAGAGAPINRTKTALKCTITSYNTAFVNTSASAAAGGTAQQQCCTVLLHCTHLYRMHEAVQTQYARLAADADKQELLYSQRLHRSQNV